METMTCGAGTLEDGTQINAQFGPAADLWPEGDIFTGTLGDDPAQPYDATPSAAFVDGKTCFTLGTPG